MKKIISIQLIEIKKDAIYRITVDRKEHYIPFDNEAKAKAAAFDEACKASMEGDVYVSYISI